MYLVVGNKRTKFNTL